MTALPSLFPGVPPTHVATDYASSAEFSADRRYRYVLRRTWDVSAKPMAFIGLNPSTADEITDDATIRRCMGFSRREGCGGLVMLNLFAFRSRDPRGLWTPGVEPIGADNDRHILAEARKASIVVAAWGVHAATTTRPDVVVRMLLDAGITLHALETSLAGHPRHPLYLRGDLRPRVWKAA